MQQQKAVMPSHLRQALGITPKPSFRSRFLGFIMGQKPRETEDLLAALRTMSRIAGLFRGFGGQSGGY
jgi:hypothetical protein